MLLVMLTSTRLLLLGTAALLALGVACDGGGGDPEENVRRDVNAMFDAVFGEDLDVAEFVKYFPEECPQDIGELALGLAFAMAFIGESEIEIEITEVELRDDDRALVSISGSGGILDAFGSDGGTSQDLWVVQDGRWRTTEDCDAFDDERAALGLDQTDASAGLGNDGGPPVAGSIGQPLPIGDVTVTARGASRSSEAVSSFSDPPQGVFVIVELSLANNGQAPTDPWSALRVQLFDDRDRTWDSAGVPIDNVGPGFSQDFSVRWDVPLDATGFRVVVSASPFSDVELPDDFAPWEVALGDVQ